MEFIIVWAHSLVRAITKEFVVWDAKNLAEQNVWREKFSSTNVRRRKIFSSPSQHQPQTNITTKMVGFEHPFCNEWHTIITASLLMHLFEALHVFQWCIANWLQALLPLHRHASMKEQLMSGNFMCREKNYRELRSKITPEPRWLCQK